MGIVIFLCGLAASGKTTLAKQLEQELPAVRLTLDVRMKAKTDLPFDDPRYGELVGGEKELMWSEAQQLLAAGQNVILDWSLWSRKARREWTQRVTSAGYEHRLYYLNVPLSQLRQRLESRNAAATATDDPNVHIIPFEEVERFSQIFEPPQSDENINLFVIDG